MNPSIQRAKSFQVGFIFILLGDLITMALYVAVSQTTKDTMEYWLRDLAFIVTRAGTVSLAALTAILLAVMKPKQSEITAISLVSIVLIAVPLAIVFFNLTSKDWWVATLAYSAYAAAGIGACVASIRAKGNVP